MYGKKLCFCTLLFLKILITVQKKRKNPSGKKFQIFINNNKKTKNPVIIFKKKKFPYMNSQILINTHQEQKRSVTNLLSFFQDDRGKNLLRSFSALSQNYIDLRSACLFGNVKDNNTNEKQQNKNSSSSIFSIVFDPSDEKFQTVQQKVKSISDRVDSAIAATNSLLSEMLQLMTKVKETSHATFICAFNLVDGKQKNAQNSGAAAEFLLSITKMLKDLLENLVSEQLQNKIITIHVLFYEVIQALKNGLKQKEQQREIQWKLSLDQIRIYQATLMAEFNLMANSGVGSGSHPLESIASTLDSIGSLCAKIQ
jgi:hypothetical protein